VFTVADAQRNAIQRSAIAAHHRYAIHFQKRRRHEVAEYPQPKASGYLSEAAQKEKMKDAQKSCMGTCT
jgi:hypothetical protein